MKFLFKSLHRILAAVRCSGYSVSESNGNCEDLTRQSDSTAPLPSLLVWSSPSTKGAGAYQLWENYRESISEFVPRVGLLRGHDEEDSFPNPQIKLNRVSLIWALTDLTRLIKREGSANVVTSISQSDIIFGLFVRRFVRVNWTIYVLGQPYPVADQTNGLKRHIWKKLWLRAARRADRIVAVSDYIGKIISPEVGNKKIDTVYPSLSNHQELFSKIEFTSGSQLRVGFVGRLSPEKDPALFCSIMDGFEGVTAKIYGDGPLRPQVEEISQDVELLGFRPQEEIYSGLDVLVMTSKSEGLPMVLVEASHMGIVPLVCDVGGCIEAIHPENRNLLVVPKIDRENVAVWRARLRKLQDENLRQEIRQLQAEWAVSKFDNRKNSQFLASLVIQEANNA
ncbi:glycosyltransferase [Arthrobacter sp. ZGTC412]|uniref:glycosyltransferase n=1 Tax=Arthrobacter sp. ZGTC412 TaxID=2058900 RepID=UPI000CE4FF1D|nr:glycosyltransferase [Arthrobacter sp. ZGTC412]